tara:strand:- start:1307 stop:1480 length:174 start_codon:yes stop_codon:yes gene_type:complete
MSVLIQLEKKYKEEKISPEWLRTFKGYESYTDEEAESELKKLEQLSALICRHLRNTS